jgi:hypothetical protein
MLPYLQSGDRAGQSQHLQCTLAELSVKPQRVFLFRRGTEGEGFFRAELSNGASDFNPDSREGRGFCATRHRKLRIRPSVRLCATTTTAIASSADPPCDGKVTTHKEDRSRFQVKEDIFEQQSPAPCAREEAIHEGARGHVVGISFVVKANQETGIEDNHRPSP